MSNTYKITYESGHTETGVSLKEAALRCMNHPMIPPIGIKWDDNAKEFAMYTISNFSIKPFKLVYASKKKQLDKAENEIYEKIIKDGQQCTLNMEKFTVEVEGKV